jgi:alpha-L-fucosidase 2
MVMAKVRNFLMSCLPAFLLVLAVNIGIYAQDPDLSVYFKEPAAVFEEALPLGNGRIGAMIYGNPNADRIVLNEKTLWSGGPHSADNEDAHKYLKEIQALLLEDRNMDAQKLLQKHFVSKGAGSGFGKGANVPFGCYQTMGDLSIRWRDTTAIYTDYKRVLDLRNATVSTSWVRAGVKFIQEAYISIPDNVLIIRLSASKRGKITFATTLTRKENSRTAAAGSLIKMTGQLPDGADAGMRFASGLQVVSKGGKQTVNGQEILVEGADECLLVWTASTDYKMEDLATSGNDPMPDVLRTLKKAAGSSEWIIRQNAVAAYNKYWKRNRFELTAQVAGIDTLSTPERLVRYSRGLPDPQLPVLYYNFGRYLLIASSQPGGLPANLQGIWAAEYQTPWNGDYHLNINLQMNYWPAEVTGLGDLAEPLHRFIAGLVGPGRKTAEAYYNAPGWVAHVISNPWGFTSPGEGADWGSTLTGGAWLSRHIWEHYLFTADTAFLEKYYPVLKEAATFLSAILIEEPKTGFLVTAPSNSPENTYFAPDGFRGQTAMGPTMDMQICRDIFDFAIRAAGILKRDKEWSVNMAGIRKRLVPTRVGTEGDINEWFHDWQDSEPQHRHLSHLYGLYPYDEITPWHTPELAKAARISLTQRGDGGTGWSKAWKISFWARLGDGDHALKLLNQLFTPVNPSKGLNAQMGGTYPNLFCAHPPFQIDGNFGGTAAIAEMLLQSHGKDQVIRFLPALPSDPGWSTGSLKGVRARGAFIVDFNWEKGKLIEGRIQSLKDGKCKVLLPAKMMLKDSDGKILGKAQASSQVLEIHTRRDEVYRVVRT